MIGTLSGPRIAGVSRQATPPAGLKHSADMAEIELSQGILHYRDHGSGERAAGADRRRTHLRADRPTPTTGRTTLKALLRKEDP